MSRINLNTLFNSKQEAIKEALERAGDSVHVATVTGGGRIGSTAIYTPQTVSPTVSGVQVVSTTLGGWGTPIQGLQQSAVMPYSNEYDRRAPDGKGDAKAIVAGGESCVAVRATGSISTEFDHSRSVHAIALRMTKEEAIAFAKSLMKEAMKIED